MNEINSLIFEGEITSVIGEKNGDLLLKVKNRRVHFLDGQIMTTYLTMGVLIKAKAKGEIKFKLGKKIRTVGRLFDLNGEIVIFSEHSEIKN